MSRANDRDREDGELDTTADVTLNETIDLVGEKRNPANEIDLNALDYEADRDEGHEESAPLNKKSQSMAEAFGVEVKDDGPDDDDRSEKAAKKHGEGGARFNKRELAGGWKGDKERDDRGRRDRKRDRSPERRKKSRSHSRSRSGSRDRKRVVRNYRDNRGVDNRRNFGYAGRRNSYRRRERSPR